jgi:hypothetical protein
MDTMTLFEDRTLKLNCAQAIALGNSDLMPEAETRSEAFKDMGGGRTPGQTCGAYFAAQEIVEYRDVNALPALQSFFKEEAGSLQCREIRKMKKADCGSCVAIADRFLKNTFISNTLSN